MQHTMPHGQAAEFMFDKRQREIGVDMVRIVGLPGFGAVPTVNLLIGAENYQATAGPEDTQPLGEHGANVDKVFKQMGAEHEIEHIVGKPDQPSGVTTELHRQFTDIGIGLWHIHANRMRHNGIATKPQVETVTITEGREACPAF